MVTQCHRPEESKKVQAFNDFLVFGAMTISSVSSGTVLATLGWAAINELVFPFVLAAALLLGWISLKERLRPA
jgi:hypothetical protein